jgi:energy-coupling factor transport system ATP-binding protein
MAGLSIFDISKKAGTVLQDTDGQFVGLSAAEDIAFAAENDCVPPVDMRRRVLETAALVDMETCLAKAPQNLSGGQKQRVSLAGVLIDDVDILLFDEPLANLDPAAGKDAMDIIDRLHNETGKTVIIVEHRLEDVLYRPVDRVIVMNEGRIAADMPPAELLASGILRENGIREPLYVSALRYSGCEITPGTHCEDVNALVFERDRLIQWEKGLPPRGEAPVPEALLEVKHLSFAYVNPAEGETGRALDDVSFVIPRGLAVSLVGKNGAGKSTLAKLICGFEQPASGSIYFEGRDISDLSIKERAQRVGYVMQNPNQMFSFPLIFDETALALRNAGLGGAELTERVHDALNVCGLYPFRNWPISALSYGQKKRLSIAAILVMDVKLLILDEPTAGQDFRHYTEIMEFLRLLNRERGLSILMITHDMHLMLEYSDKTIVIADGKLVDGKLAGERFAMGAASSGLWDPEYILTDDGIIEAASLKRTSLFDLALKAGIHDGRRFVRHFIDYDRREREAARQPRLEYQPELAK